MGNLKSKLAQLQAIYDRLPKMQCAGFCQHCCQVALFEPIEQKNLQQNRVPLPTVSDERLICSALVNGRCSIYMHRPLICRLWGMVNDPKMTCPFGCPAERILSNAEVAAMIQELRELLPGTPYNPLTELLNPGKHRRKG